MLGMLAEQLQASGSAIGLLPTLTPLGYGAGILLLAPLGDRFDRKSIIPWKALVLIGAMFLGMSAGSWLGGVAMEQGGWRGVCVLAALALRLSATPQRAPLFAKSCSGP